MTVVNFPADTLADIPVENVLEEAKKTLESGQVLVCGLNKDGDIYAASSTGDMMILLWVLEQCKKILLEDDEED